MIIVLALSKINIFFEIDEKSNFCSYCFKKVKKRWESLYFCGYDLNHKESIEFPDEIDDELFIKTNEISIKLKKDIISLID